MKTICILTSIPAVAAVAWLSTFTSPAAVLVEDVPDHGVQPVTRTGTDGTIHLIYLSGDPKKADIEYRRRAPHANSWSPAIRVNSQQGSAVAIGTIRGAQLALGSSDRVHVAWNGSRADAKAQSSPMLYARMRGDGSGFEPERNLMTRTMHLDGGGTVAADKQGNVHVIWHGSPKEGPSGESHRGVYVATSQDNGASFRAERRVSPANTGACGCCGLVANADESGQIWIGYRIAKTATERGWSILRSANQGKMFTEVLQHPWNIGTCPMSSASVDFARSTPVCSWESQGSVFLWLGSKNKQPVSVAKGKHPRTTINQQGKILVVWTEGTGWQKAGSLAWQVFDQEGNRTGEGGRKSGVSVWSFACPFTLGNGDFVTLH